MEEKRVCEECGSDKIIDAQTDKETLWGDIEADYPHGSEGAWFWIYFSFCADCRRVQGGKVELSA
jgi:hypothetical protein